MAHDWQYSRIGKEYHFSAAHFLTGVPSDHPCAGMHGHNYVVEVEVRGDISQRNGFCAGLDFSQIDKVMKPMIEKLDHKVINDTIENPTAERIAQWFLSNATPNYFYSVKVWETSKCWAQAVNAGGIFHKVHRD